jgi:hypothetical protein
MLAQNFDTIGLVDAVLCAVPWDANGVVAPAVDAVQVEAAIPVEAQLHYSAQVHIAL